VSLADYAYWQEALALAAYLVWAVGATVILLLERRPPAATLAWLLALLFLPYVGAIIYFFFGPRRLRRKRLRYAKGRSAVAGKADAMLARPANLSEDIFLRYRQLAALIERLDQPAPARAQALRIYAEGDECYADMLAAIESAKHHLHLEYYIWRDDQIGTRMRDALVERARAGVQVRLLLDAVGSTTTADAFFRPLEEAGGEVAWFNRPRVMKLRLRYFNFRTHRKILVVDGTVAFTGGMNVTDDHASSGAGDSGSAGGWRDTHLRIEGAPAGQLQRVFLDDWVFAHGPCEIQPGFFPDCAATEGPFVQVAASGPDQETWAIQRLLFNAIANARSSIRITTPYFVPDEPMLAALIAAALRGVSVRILVPKKSDSFLVTAAARSYFDELARLGVEIWEYGPQMLHAKTAVFDDIVSVVGSANFDNRSFRLNFEVVAVVYGGSIARRLNTLFDADIVSAVRYRSPGRKRPVHERLLMGAARLFSPLL